MWTSYLEPSGPSSVDTMVQDCSVNRFQLRAVERELTSEVWTAKSNFQLARSRLSILMRSMPSGIPPPNCGLLQSHSEREAALEAFNRALRRFTDFVIHRIIPENLADEACASVDDGPRRLLRVRAIRVSPNT